MKMQKWKTVKLGDVAPVSASTSEISSDQVWLLNLDAVEPVSGSVLNYVYVAKSGIGSSTAKFDTENVLYSKLRPYLNKVVVPALPGYATSEMLPLKPNRELLQREYLALFLRSPSFLSHISDKVAGAKMPRVVTKDLKESLIPLPPLKEQKRIADVLDKAADLISLRKQQIEKLDLLVKSKFIDMFGDPLLTSKKWDDMLLSGLCLKITDGTHQSPHFVQQGIPFLFISNIVDCRITYAPSKFIDREEYKKLIKRTPIEVGDLLLTIVGSYGNPAVVMSTKEFCFQRHIAYLKPDASRVNSFFLHAAFRMPYVRRQMDARAKGIAQKTLNLSELNKIEIPLPPLKLQTEFAAFVEHVVKQKAQMQTGLEKLELNYKALMAECFAGEDRA